MLSKTEFLEWIIALTVFLLLGIGAFFLFSPKREAGPDVVIFGDSIYAEGREADGVPILLANETGLQIYNAALGGSCLSRTDTERRMDSQWDSLSLAGLPKSVVSGDFAVQRQVRVREAMTEYFPEVIAGLEKIDFEGVTYLLIGHGLNDYQNGAILDDPEDPYDEYTFGGALRSVLRTFRETYPEIRILLMTPTYSWYLSQEKSCEELDWGGGLLKEYVELEMEIAAQCGVDVIDLYHDLYRQESFEDWKEFTRDGIHPNEKGRELIARKIEQYLEELR